jgi:hypothetical protein
LSLIDGRRPLVSIPWDRGLRAAIFLGILAVAAVAQADKPPVDEPPDPDAPSVHIAAKKDGQPVPAPKVKVGEPFEVVVSVGAKPDQVITLPATFDVEPFEVLGRSDSPTGPRVAEGAEKLYTLRVVAWKTGKQTLPAIPITYLPPTGAARRVMTAPLEVEVVPVIAGEQRDEALAPTVSPVDVMERDWRLVIGALIVVGAGGIAFGVMAYVRWRRRRKRGERIPEQVKDARPAHEIALEKLRQLAESPLLADADRRVFYLVLSGIVREFFGRRYGFEALELTTTELLDQLTTHTVRSTEDLATWLNDCDMVKFARVSVAHGEAKMALAAGVALVEKHKKVIPEITPPPVSVGGAP